MTITPDKTVDLSGLAIHYRQTGPPDGTPVVALHGHPGTPGTWDEVAAGLCASGRYRFIAVTQRGYGASGRAESYSLEALRDDVFGFADALGLDRFVLMGHTSRAAAELTRVATQLWRPPTARTGRRRQPCFSADGATTG